jgi:hypothetical protein
MIVLTLFVGTSLCSFLQQPLKQASKTQLAVIQLILSDRLALDFEANKNMPALKPHNQFGNR